MNTIFSAGKAVFSRNNNILYSFRRKFCLYEKREYAMYQNTPFYPIRPIRDFRDMLAQSAQRFANRPAFKLKNAEGEYYEVLYPAFQADVYALGTMLMELGLQGEKIAVIGHNCYAWCLSYLAVTCGVGVVVPIDKELPACDIENILRVSGAAAILFDEKVSSKVLESRAALPEQFRLISFAQGDAQQGILSLHDLLSEGHALLKEGDTRYQDAPIDAEGLGSLLFTSGTTGMAKGVMLSQRNICEDIMALSGVVEIRPTDQLLSILPLHHTYECSLGFIMILYSGACIAFCEGLRYIVKNMQEVEPTIFVTVPLMLEKMHHRILKAAAKKKGGRLILGIGKALSNATSALGMDLNDKIFGEIQRNFGGRLRLIITGAAAISPEVVKDFKTFGIPVYLGYGLTECSPLVIGNHDRLELPDSVGVPLPGVEAKIVNPDFSGVGEICVKGPMVMLGYYNDPEATAEVMDADGFFHTGDLGTVDENGYYRITGRIKNVIVTKNGKNIYPEEVEYYLNKNPFVAESIVVGEEEDDETMVTAKVFPNVEAIREKLKQSSVSKEEIFKALSNVVKEVNKKLPSYKNIKKLVVREQEFVKTTTQKIKRFAEDEKKEK